MEDKLTDILTLLEKDLKDIDSAVKHISKSKEAAQTLVDSNNEFTKSFRVHMEELQTRVKDVLITLKTETNDVTENWRIYTTGLKELCDRLNELTRYYESVNFPARLDKIDASVSTLQQGVISSQALLNDIYRRIDQHAEKQRDYYSHIIKHTQQLKIYSIIIIVFTLSAIVIALFMLLKLK